MKFEAVRIHYLNDVFDLMSSKNFATMATNGEPEFELLGEISVHFWSWEMKFSSN